MANIKDLEKKTTPQAKATTIPGRIVDAAVNVLAPTGVGVVNKLASAHPNLLSAGEFVERNIIPKTTTPPSTPNQTDDTNGTKKKKKLAGYATVAVQKDKGAMGVGRYAKGGLVSYKSVLDME